MSTYNAPRWLEKVLWGYSVQSFRNFEIVIADDGSNRDTLAVVERVRRSTGLPLRHVWQEHKGFRKCRILNRATQVAIGDYIIYTDGDCIPRQDMVEEHVRLACPGTMLSAGYVRLPLNLSQQMSVDDVVSGRATDFFWLMRNGLQPSWRCARLLCNRRIGWLLDKLSQSDPHFNGCNSSAWKKDVVMVNGFNQEMGYGGEDRELGERLANAGVQRKLIRNRAVVVHLEHERAYETRDVWDKNNAIREQVRTSKSTWATQGLRESGYC